MDLPFFSIIVPTYNRPRALSACLASLAVLDYPRDRLEVIVVDDGSACTPEDIVRQCSDRLCVRLETVEHAGPAAARNRGAELARGNYLAFTDDDCEMAPDWLLSMAEQFRQVPDCAAGGRTKNHLDNVFTETSQLLIDFLFDYYNADPARARFFTSNNLALSGELFDLVGRFNTSFPRAAGEDRELCDRLLTDGHPVVHVPWAVVHHAHQLNLRSFLRQHFNYGRAAYHFRSLHMRRHRQGVRLEPCRFYFSLLGQAFRGRRGRRAMGMVFMLWLTQVVNALGFFWAGAASLLGRRTG